MATTTTTKIPEGKYIPTLDSDSDDALIRPAKPVTGIPNTPAPIRTASQPDAIDSPHGKEMFPIVPKVLELFRGDSAEAKRWMDTPHPVFGGATPGEMVKTTDGYRKVEALLNQLEYGVYV